MEDFIMIVTLPLETMTIEDKISTMEILWEDISKTPENYQSPDWHQNILKEREKNIANGTDSFEDWDDVKKEIWNSVT